MSVNRPQTTSIAFAILTLFASAAWGQQFGEENPIFVSDRAVFGADKLENENLFSKKPFEEEIVRTARLNAKTAASAKATGYSQIDSLFGPSTQQLVDQNGYFLPKGEGSLWKDVVRTPSSENRVTSLKAAASNATSKATGNSQLDDEGFGPVIEIAETADEQQPASTDLDFAAQSKLRLRIGFDALVFQRGRAENTIFATDDTGNEWAFSDFDFSEGDARYFIQFMGDDQSGLEFTFFDIRSFSSTIEATGENVVPSFFGGVPANISNNFDLNYTSRLKNFELNSWVRKNALQRSGYGVRHINLDESFDVLAGGNIASGLFSRTNNDLWGLQRMWERRRPMLNRLTLIGGVDAGLYLNRVQIDVDTLNVDDASEADNIAGSLGFNLGLEYLVADHVTLRLGYEGLGIFGVGTASAQSLEQNLGNGLDDPELGSIYAGGFYIGAIAAF